MPEAPNARLTVDKASAGQRLDKFLALAFSDHSRSFLQKLIADGFVTVNGQAVKQSHELGAGEAVEVVFPPPTAQGIAPEDIPVEIIHQDAEIVVVNKPPGMVVHPTRAGARSTLVNALAFRIGQLAPGSDPLRPGVVHRLDRDTSGVMLVAKTATAHARLAAQFEKREVHKEYLAVVEGALEFDRDVVDVPIGKDRRTREKMRVALLDGRKALSEYEAAERFQGFTLVKVRLHTGRTHQIRVHMRHIGHPVVADALYGRTDACYESDLARRDRAPGEEPLIDRQALHSWRIAFRHPATGQTMTFTAPIPDDLTRLIAALRRHRAAR